MANVPNRNSSIELLRLLLMAMIVLHHCIVVGLGFNGLSSNSPYDIMVCRNNINIMFFINSFCIVAVNTFVLVSGYYGINVKRNKILFLLYAILFYTVFFSLIPSIFEGRIKHGLLQLFVFSQQTNYWFMREYFILLLFCPMINRWFQAITKKQLLFFIAMIALVSCYLGFVFQRSANVNGYNFINFIMLYAMGRYIGIYGFNLPKWWSLFLYIISSLVIAFLCIFFYRIELYMESWKMTYYNNPLVIVSSICLFQFFIQLSMNNRFINKVSKSSLSIYLFGCSELILSQSTLFIRENADMGGGCYVLTVVTVLTVFVALVVDQARLKSWNIISQLLKCKE